MQISIHFRVIMEYTALYLSLHEFIGSVTKPLYLKESTLRHNEMH